MESCVLNESTRLGITRIIKAETTIDLRRRIT